MRKLTRMILLSSAIVFPSKMGFSSIKDASTQKERREVEKIAKIVASLKEGQTAANPPDFDAQTLMRIATMSVKIAEQIIQANAGKTIVPTKAVAPQAVQSKPQVKKKSQSVFTFRQVTPEIFFSTNPEIASIFAEVEMFAPSGEKTFTGTTVSFVPTLSIPTFALQVSDVPDTLKPDPDIISLAPQSFTVVPETPATESVIANATRALQQAIEDDGDDTPLIVSSAEGVKKDGMVKKVRVRLTFYSGERDRWGSRVAWRQVSKAQRGRTAAADPKVFPYGTWIQVPGFGKLRVEDTGTDVKNRKASRGKEPIIDVYVGNEKEAMRLANCTPDYVEITML